MESEVKVHVWEIECANRKCRDHFHILTDNDHVPAKELLCLKCEIEERKRATKHTHIKKDGHDYNLHVGYDERAHVYIPRTIPKVEVEE